MDGILVRARQETEALLPASLCSFSLMKESCARSRCVHELPYRGEGLPLQKLRGTAVFYITSL